MTETVRRLVKIGYSEEHAWKLYNLYASNCDLDGLESFIVGCERP